MIIDFHTHCFPDAIAEKALAKLSAAASYPPSTDGTVRGAMEKLKASGIDMGVVCSIATNARQLPKVNGFAIGINDLSSNLIALGSAHPDSDELEEELQRLVDHDIRGIKIHPEYMPYYVDSPEWDRVFGLCEDMGIFVVTHAGYDFISPDRIAATPDRIARVLDRHPKLTLVAAHLGGNRLWDEVRNVLCGRENLYLDTSVPARYEYDAETTREIILAHGTDRVLFGSDMPWSDPKKTLDFIRSLGFDRKDEAAILGGNAEKLLMG
jgi:predicted TIM-barrel fold metal-dependent hydrolase